MRGSVTTLKALRPLISTVTSQVQTGGLTGGGGAAAAIAVTALAGGTFFNNFGTATITFANQNGGQTLGPGKIVVGIGSDDTDASKGQPVIAMGTAVLTFAVSAGSGAVDSGTATSVGVTTNQLWWADIPAGVSDTLTFKANGSANPLAAYAEMGVLVWIMTGAATGPPTSTGLQRTNQGDPQQVSGTISANGVGIAVGNLVEFGTGAFSSYVPPTWTNTTTGTGDTGNYINPGPGQDILETFGAHSITVGSPTNITVQSSGTFAWSFLVALTFASWNQAPATGGSGTRVQPSFTAALLSAIRSMVKAQPALSATALTKALLGLIKSSVQARAGPTALARLLSSIDIDHVKTRVAPSATTTLLGHIAEMAMARTVVSAKTTLLGRAAEMAMARTLASATAALLGFGKIQSTVRAAPTNSVALLGRIVEMTMARAAALASSQLQAILGLGKVMTTARAAPSATAALLGLIAEMTKAHSVPSVTAQIRALFGLGTVQVTVRSVPKASMPLLGRIAEMVRASGASSVTTKLLGTVTGMAMARAATSVAAKLLSSIDLDHVKARVTPSTVTSLFGKITSMVGPQVVQPASFVNFTYLFTQATSQIKSLQTLTAQSPLSRALTDAAKVMVTARAAQAAATTKLLGHIMTMVPTHETMALAASLFGRPKGPGAQARPAISALANLLSSIDIDHVKSRVATSATTALFGRIAEMTRARFSQPTGSASLLARAVAQVKALETLTVVAPLSTALTGLGKAMTAVRAGITSTTLLQARIVEQIKALETLTVVAPVSAALTGLGKIMTTARANFTGAVSLRSVVASQVKSLQTLTAQSPLARALTGVTKVLVTARLAQASGTIALQTRAMTAARVQEALTVAATLAARVAAMTRARAASATLTQYLLALVLSITESRVQSKASTSLQTRVLTLTRAQPTPSASAGLLGKATSAARASFGSASRSILLAAQAIAQVKARFTQPAGTLSLVARAATQVITHTVLFTVGRLSAIPPGRATIMFRGSLAPSSLRSNVRAVKTIVAAFYSILTTITSVLPIKSKVTAYTATTTVSGGTINAPLISLQPQETNMAGPTVSGVQTIPLGATVLFTSTFQPSNPPGASVNVSYFQNGALTTGTGPIPMTFQSGTTWTAQWDSGVSDGGRVDWEVFSTSPLPVAAQIGFFFLSSNDASITGL